MKRIITHIFILLMITLAITGCASGEVNEVTFDELFLNPGVYNTRNIAIEGFYFHGFETVVLSEKLDYSRYRAGHLIPKGEMIWIAGGIPKDIYDKLNQQQMMGPLERYGKVRITGKFESGGRYGHLGAYDSQLTPKEITILLWSPPISETMKEGFAIYLTKADIPPADMEALSHVEIAEQPIITVNDVITYDAGIHEITLTADAFGRISSLEVPVRGKSFMVCVDKNPIYWGAFWTRISSLSFDGVTIWKPLSPQNTNVVKLELGYPSPSFYRGEDPRNSAEIMKSLEQAGKLSAAH